MIKKIIYLFVCISLFNCEETKKVDAIPVGTQFDFDWKAANIYFLLTDRFNNGDTLNDVNFERTGETGKLRGFEGGDIKGVTQKIKDGYFTDLGVNAIWMTPIVEQIHGGTDEGTGLTYGFHGYWTKDWTNIDPNYGTKEDLKELVEVAHENNIRILLDAVINHTGPVTAKDAVWPQEWVRTEPQCQYKDYETTVTCTLVKNLPDILTESNENVELPPQLIEKWQREGRYEEEVNELDAYFERTGHPRAPRFYIMKWLTDYITEFGIDGYRVDTVKHTEESVWQEFRIECDYAYEEWKRNNPEKVMDNSEFYLVGEVYGYGITGGRLYNFGDKEVDYFDASFNSLINFDLKGRAHEDYESIFKNYSNTLQDDLSGYSILNYLSSHDDGSPFDPRRERAIEAGSKLLLTPGASQIYYGDETARSLVVEGTIGDATLRSNMNWQELDANQGVLDHWQKLGRFRAKHPAIGMGLHQMISQSPYTFYRSYYQDGKNDLVAIGLEMDKGEKELDVSKLYEDGTVLFDAYSGQEVKVLNGKAVVNSEYDVVLLEVKE